MDRRGQITIFIIIAIVVISVILFFFVFKENLFQYSATSDFIGPIEKIEMCFENISEITVIKVIGGGGYFFPPERALDAGIPLYYENSLNYMPSLENIENEISFWIEQQMFFCTANFAEFQDLKVSSGEINVETQIKTDEVIFSLQYPLTISNRDKTSFFNKPYEKKFNVRIGELYQIIDGFVEEQKQNEGVCLSCLNDITDEKDLYIKLFESEGAFLFFIEDKNSILNNQTIKWRFAGRSIRGQ